MHLLDEFRAEHCLIDRVAGSLIRFSKRAAADNTSVVEVENFVRFFRVFVAGFHHDREENVLFPALVARAEVPADRGPLPAIAADHRTAASLVEELEQTRKNPKAASAVAQKLAHHLWEHVDKEESVLLPESADRLRRNGVTRLEGRGATVDEDDARRLGELLSERFPPLDDPGIVRGDGCIACSAFGETCGGIEKEWWNTWERQHYRSLDEG